MEPFKRPTPIDEEIILEPSRYIMSKTDAKGIIEYANDYFIQICEYQEYELMGKPHNIIRHPDMPKVIFKLLWDRLNKGQNIYALVKNLAKSGKYYWVLTSFKTTFDDEGNIISHRSFRKAAPVDSVRKIEKLYKVLLSIEQAQGMNTAEKYLLGMLEEKNLTYDQFILNILRTDEATLKTYFEVEKSDFVYKKNRNKKGFFSRLFNR